MLIIDEALRLKPYECTSGKTTIGVGRNLDDKGLSEVEAMYLLTNDINEFQLALSTDKDVGDIFGKMNEERKQALINMAFNMGVPTLKKFKKMWQALDDGHYKLAALEAADSRWYGQVKSRGRRICDIIKSGNLDSYKGLK